MRGTIWTGTLEEINESGTYRTWGHPLTYNAEREIRARPGDLIMLRVRTPADGEGIKIENSNSKSAFSIRCTKLIKMNVPHE